MIQAWILLIKYTQKFNLSPNCAESTLALCQNNPSFNVNTTK